MSTTTATQSETTTSSEQAEEFMHVDPGTIVIGANVRADTRPDAKEFRRSIKERGVLEAVTCYRDEAGELVCLRGQRRTVTAVEVGTPTGLIPVRVVPQPEDADRISDQMVENIHRTAMREAEVMAGVEQLALLGVSAAQIAKRTSIARKEVNAAVRVAKTERTRARFEGGELTLEDAAIFAEFEHDPAAIEQLERARSRSWGDSVQHVAQRLRDEAEERAAYDAEVETYRAAGLPVLTAAEAEEAGGSLLLADMRTADGEEIPEEQWPSLPGVAVILTEEWEYPDTTDSDADTEGDQCDDGDEADEYAEPIKVLRPTWVVLDPEASGLVHRSRFARTGEAHNHENGHEGEDDEAAAEAKREERRMVIANNKAWLSAETVRREWLTGFLARKSAPKGAEALICEAVLTGNHTLAKAMERRHPMLLELLGIETSPGYYGGISECAALATKASTPKAATMTALGAVIAGWEASTGKHTWRNPSGWDARVLNALIEWGYQPGDVERLLIERTDDHEHDTEQDAEDDTATHANDQAPESTEGDEHAA